MVILRLFYTFPINLSSVTFILESAFVNSMISVLAQKKPSVLPTCGVGNRRYILVELFKCTLLFFTFVMDCYHRVAVT